MASVQLQVNVARGQLDTLIADVNKLGSKSIKINVDASGFQALEASVLKTINAQTRYNNSVARVKEAQNAVAIAQQKTAQTANMAQAAQAKLATQVEKTGTAQVQYATQIEKTATAQANLATQQEKTATAAVNYETQVERTATAAEKASGKTQKYGNSIKKAAKNTKELTGLSKILGDSLGNIVAKIVAWQVINATVATMIRSFKDAVSTMKAVDDELVTVRKVTGATAGEMKRIEKQAYATASAYGVAADEYLESVAAFARAGYGDQAEALAELSTKTQIVGDTTAEVANQFLLAVDAAYQYKGNIESLTKVLDGGNEIDNHYATSIEKIAEGLGKVAPIAAQTHVGINELTAAIGTITAATQRSGTEAATALRALLLNIVGDTKTEIEEGVTWTTGEIAGLTDVIKKYAPAAYEAAQATGEVIDPMEAIGGLAQSMKDGLLTEQELMIMVSDIGGKLRTSHLLALLQNWDMYKSMLEDFGNAAGSADAEVSNALDSWTRKTMQLKNTWTEFLTNFINSDTVKGGLDILISAIESLDGGFGEFAVTAGIVFGILKMAPAVLSMVSSGFTMLGNALYILQPGFFGVSNAAVAAALGMTEAEVAATRLNATLGIVALAIGAVIYAFNSAKQSAEEVRNYTQKTAEESLSAYKNIQELKSAYETAAEGSDAAVQAANDLTAALEGQGFAVKNLKQDYIELAEAQREKTLAEQKASLYSQEQKIYEKISGFDSTRIMDAMLVLDGLETLPWIVKKLADLGGGVLDLIGVTANDMDDELYSIENIISLYDAAVELLPDLTPGEDDYNALAEFVSLLQDEVVQYKSLKSAIDMLQGGTKEQANEYAEAISVIQSHLALVDWGNLFGQYANAKDENGKEMFAIAKEEIQSYVEALVEQGEITEETAEKIIDYYDVVGKLEDPTYAAAAASGDLISALVDESGQLTDTAVQALSTNSALLAVAQAEAQAGLAAANVDLSNLISQLHGVSAAAADAAAKLALAGLAGAGAPSARGTYVAPRSSGFYESLAQNRGEWVQAAQNREFYQGILDDIAKINEDSENGPPGGGGGGGGGGSAEDSFLAALEDEIDLLKSELALMRERGASEEDQIKKIQQIQEALHAEAEYLRQIGASQAEINKLSKEWWSYQDEIYDIRLDLLKSELALMEEREDDTETQIAKAREIQAVLREQIDSLKEIGASQTEINKLEKEWWELENEIADKTNQLAEDRLSLEEKILAVQEAQVALMNAQNERTVRMYNAATGQWEWTANPKDVQSAQEALDSAQQDLSDFYDDHKELQPEADEMGAAELLAGMALTVPDEMIPEIIGTNGTSAPATAKKLQEIFTSAGAAKAMVMQSTIGTQNNGNVYYFGGISFTEAQAGSMTLKQLAEQSRILNIYSGAN